MWTSKRAPFALAIVALLCLWLGACGETGKESGTASRVVSNATRLLGDEDSDAKGKLQYNDGDDGDVRYFGRAADAADTRAIADLVKRYYYAAAAENGAKACGMMLFVLAESLPETYGRAPGPRYLNGGGGCQAIMSRLFKHFHTQLSAPPVVTAVRVNGSHADALLGWTVLPAAYMEVVREAGVWKINDVLALPLP